MTHQVATLYKRTTMPLFFGHIQTVKSNNGYQCATQGADTMQYLNSDYLEISLEAENLFFGVEFSHDCGGPRFAWSRMIKSRSYLYVIRNVRYNYFRFVGRQLVFPASFDVSKCRRQVR
jgi:hypothetical protein